MSVLRTRTGRLIAGTSERVFGVALIAGAHRHPDTGRLEVEYEGTTKIDWDSQRTMTRPDGQRFFVDEDGESWVEGELELVEED